MSPLVLTHGHCFQTLSANNHVLSCRQDFKSNETQLFKNVEKLQKESKGADVKKKGGMKEAADSAEQIRKWVSRISYFYRSVLHTLTLARNWLKFRQ